MKMKKMNKLMAIMLVFNLLTINLVGCGNAASPAIGEGVVIDGTEESSIEAEEKDIPDGEVPAVGKLEEETSPTVKPTTEMTTTPEPEPEPVAPPHVHEYKVESSTEATCATEGRVVKVCDCGESKVEFVPASGNHDWKEVTTIINHPELGHVETVKTQVGMTEPYTIYECGYCGHREDTPDALETHMKSYIPEGNRAHVFSNTIMYDYPSNPIYEETQVWQVDQNSWDETVVTGYICTVCNATK